MKLPKYIRETDQCVTLDIPLQPCASRDEIDIKHEAYHLKVCVAAPPVDSAANKALLKFIAKSLDVPLRSLTLVRGEKTAVKFYSSPTPIAHQCLQEFINNLRRFQPLNSFSP